MSADYLGNYASKGGRNEIKSQASIWIGTIYHIAPLSHLAVSHAAPAQTFVGRCTGFKVATCYAEIPAGLFPAAKQAKSAQRQLCPWEQRLKTKCLQNKTGHAGYCCLLCRFAESFFTNHVFMEATLLLQQKAKGPEVWPWVGKYSLLSQHFIFKLSVTHQFSAQKSINATFGWTNSRWPRWHGTGLIAAECWHTLLQHNFEVCRLIGQVGIRIRSTEQHSGSLWAALKPQNQPKCTSDDSALPFISRSKSCLLQAAVVHYLGVMKLKPLCVFLVQARETDCGWLDSPSGTFFSPKH